MSSRVLLFFPFFALPFVIDVVVVAGVVRPPSSRVARSESTRAFALRTHSRAFRTLARARAIARNASSFAFASDGVAFAVGDAFVVVMSRSLARGRCGRRRGVVDRPRWMVDRPTEVDG